MATTIHAQETENDVSLLLRYAGPAVENGAMDVYDTAANMVAFSDYVVAAAHAVFGKETEVKAEVSAFRPGSFVTDLLFHVAGFGTSLWAASPDLGGLLLVLKESLGMYRFLEGKEPAKVEQRDDRSVNVTNNNGEVMVFNIDSLTVTLDPKAGAAVERFVGQALSRPGVTAVDVASEKGPLVSATKADAIYFRPIDMPEQSIESIVQMALTVETPTFRDGKKWQFWDGENSIQAAIEDGAFLDAVDKGEPFRKGDVLICEVRVRQVRSGKTIRMERAVVRVIQHIQRVGVQADFFDGGTQS